MTPRWTKPRMLRYVAVQRDRTQFELDRVPGENKLRMSRLLGRREAFEDILAVLEEGAPPTSGGGEGT